jgi:hypothetical protein
VLSSLLRLRSRHLDDVSRRSSLGGFALVALVFRESVMLSRAPFARSLVSMDPCATCVCIRPPIVSRGATA